MQRESISAEEYASWLSPKEAIAHVQSALGERGLEAIRRALIGGEVRSTARSFTYHKNGTSHAIALGSLIFGSDWTGVRGYDSVWEHGSHVFKTIDRYGSVTKLEAFGIRLDPAGIEQILIDAGVVEAGRVLAPHSESADNAKRPKRPLPKPAIKLWCEAYLVAYPDASRVAMERAAPLAWPEHTINREWLREFLPKRKEGRPAKSDT